MKLLILEFVTAGGLGPARAQALCDEADSMVCALARDFAAVPGVQVAVPRCASLSAASLPPQVERLPGLAAGMAGLDALTRAHDAVLPVAPESCGILHALSRQVESAGVRLLGCQPPAVACASDKWLTFQALAIAGVAQIPTCPAEGPWPDLPGPWVLKPADGCGCSGMRRFPNQALARAGAGLLAGELAETCASAPAPLLLAQPWLEGRAASLTVLGTPQGIELLTVNHQRLDVDERGGVHLQAVQTGALADRDGSLYRLAQRVHQTIPGLHGLFGIDVLLRTSGPLLVEINPRVTSAYQGLAAALGENPAARWLRAADLLPFAGAAPATAGMPSPARVGPSSRPAPAAILGWDIGGAHLKVAALAADGRLLDAVQRPCALWQGLDRLEPLLREFTGHWGRPLRHAITMSGEMVDLFPDRASGVQALVETFLRHAEGVPVAVFAGSDGFLSPDQAARQHATIASANWLALGEWVASQLPHGLVIDIGSTTCDILAFAAGRAQPRACGDRARLASGELVYTGVVRTPLMALCSEVRLAGQRHGVMAEWFAASADVYRVLGELPAGSDLHPSADGAPKDLDGSVRRLARMVGCDGPEYPLAVWQDLARQFRARQLAQIVDALDRALGAWTYTDLPQVVVCGAGAFLAEAACAQRGLSTRPFAELGRLQSVNGDTVRNAQIHRCAPAVAVAGLAHAEGSR